MTKNKALCMLITSIRERQLLSTILAAVMLAGFWIICWLFVFFVSLFFLPDSSTNVYALFIGMWLSTCVESLIRWFEHTAISTQFSQPHKDVNKEELKEYSGKKAAFYFVIGIAVTLLVGYCVTRGWLVIPRLSFEGIANDSSPNDYIPGWKEVLLNDFTLSVILMCFALRIVIYKRNHTMATTIKNAAAIEMTIKDPIKK